MGRDLALRITHDSRARPLVRAIAQPLCCAAFAVVLGGCHHPSSKFGDPAAGAEAVTGMACGSCHRIPGIENADGAVGPSLAAFGRQRLIAGRLANSPENLVRYLKAPQSIVPGNAMPDQRLTDQQARDIAAFLLRSRRP